MAHGRLLHIDIEDAERLRAARPEPPEVEHLAAGYRALGEPTRLALALALRPGHELCVCDLAWVAGRSQTLVSHHMKVLKAGGVVRSRRDGRMTMYALTERGAGLLGAATALDDA
jgi:DNA-binding transcriptional ArsR family regulator